MFHRWLLFQFLYWLVSVRVYICFNLCVISDILDMINKISALCNHIIIILFSNTEQYYCVDVLRCNHIYCMCQPIWRLEWVLISFIQPCGVFCMLLIIYIYIYIYMSIFLWVYTVFQRSGCHICFSNGFPDTVIIVPFCDICMTSCFTNLYVYFRAYRLISVG